MHRPRFDVARRLTQVCAALCLWAACSVSSASSAAGQDILGHWATEERDATIEIARCAGTGDAALCGTIVWLEEPLDENGHPEVDDENPDPALRDRPILGLRILEGFPVAPEDGVYSGGTIYDPENGKTYSCKVTPDGPNRLKIRGYVGVSLFGRTTVWSRTEAPADEPGDETASAPAAGSGGR